MIIRTKEIYRDACRRSHRILSRYLALWAWKRRVDCVVVSRHELFAYLGIKAMRGKRLDWLAQDIKDLFPYTKALYQRAGAHGSTYLSRLKFPSGAFDDRMYDVDRIRVLEQHGLRAAEISLPTESRVVAFLVTAATGLKPRK